MTELNLNEIKAQAARIVEVFGDDWGLIYEQDFDQVEAYTSDASGIFCTVFKTVQTAVDGDHMKVAEFLANAVKNVPALLVEVERLTAEGVAASERRDYFEARCEQMERDHAETVAERDRAREIAVALEQQLAEIKEYAYMGGQNGEIVRRWILGVFEAERRYYDGGEET